LSIFLSLLSRGVRSAFQLSRRKFGAHPFWAALLLVVASGADAEIQLFVDANVGNDAHAGTISQPLRTLQACVDRFSPANATTCFGRGTFHEEVEINMSGPAASARHRITAWDTDGDGDLEDETFVLDGQSTLGTAIATGYPKPDNIEISWLTFRNYQPPSSCGVGGAHFVWFRGGDGGADWWLHHNHFDRLAVQCDGLTGPNVVAIRPLGAPRLRVEHNTFTQIGGYAMRYFDGPDIVVRNNHFEIMSTGIKVWGPKVDRPVIEHNTFVCDGNGKNPEGGTGCVAQFGISFSNDVHDGLIRNNTFEDCPVAVSLATAENYGSRPNLGTVVDSNTIHQSPAICNPWEAALRVDDCTGPSNLTGSPLYVAGTIFRNNVILHHDGIRMGPAIMLRSGHHSSFSNDFVLENNTAAGFRFGLRIDQCQGFAHHLNGVELRNNIWHDITEGYYTLSFSGWQGPLPARFVSDNNVFAGGKDIYWPTVMPLSQWQGQFANDRSTVTCDPLFTADSAYRLSSSDSCARDSGVDRPGLWFDRDGDPRPLGQVDIGADEVCIEGPCSCLFCDGFEGGLGSW
jgi:hypothetical protein